MRTFSTLLLLSAFLADAAPLPTESRPAFFTLETPLQITAQAASGFLGAFGAGLIGANIGAKNARRSCLERTHPDMSDGCAWSGFGGGIGGFLIGAPIGHALGALGAGYLQGKHGAPVAALSAVVGDVTLLFLAMGIHSALDGKLLPYGSLEPVLIPLTVAGMVAIPVITQSVWDYRVRIALQPGLELRTATEDNRYLLRLVEVRF